MVVITTGDNSLVLSAHHRGPEQRTAGGVEKDLNQGPSAAFCAATWWQQFSTFNCKTLGRPIHVWPLLC